MITDDACGSLPADHADDQEAMVGVMSPGLRRPATPRCSRRRASTASSSVPGHRRGSAWRSRIEHYLTAPSKEPEPAKREVDVAYLTNQASSPGTSRHVLQLAFTTGNAHTAADLHVTGPGLLGCAGGFRIWESGACLPVVPGRGVERERALPDAGAQSGRSAAPADYGVRGRGTAGAGPGVQAGGGRSDFAFG